MKYAPKLYIYFLSIYHTLIDTYVFHVHNVTKNSLFEFCHLSKECLEFKNISTNLSLCSGQYDVYVEVDGRHKKVGEYDGQGFFGELALMYNVPRAATVVCSSPGCVWALVSFQFY